MNQTMLIREIMKDVADELYAYMPLKVGAAKSSVIFKKALQDINTYHQSNITLNTVSENGQTLAFYIAREGVASALHTAIKFKSDVKHRDMYGRTLLHAACECHCIVMLNDGSAQETLDVLLPHIEINTTDNEGCTPLFEVGFIARENKNDLGDPDQAQALGEFIEYLIENGADIHHRNNKGHTFIHGTQRLPQHLRAIFEPYAAQIQHKRLTQAVNRTAGLKKSNRKL